MAIMGFKQFITEKKNEEEDGNMARFTTVDMLMKYLGTLGYKNLKKKDARSVFVLTNDKRETVFANLINQLGGKKNPNRSFGGSMGHIDVGTFRIGVKPLSMQGTASAGVANETNLVQAINYVIEKYGVCDVLFTDGKHKHLIKEAKVAKRTGEDTAGRKKADLTITDGKGKVIPISLKKDNAEYWESADSFWRENAKHFLDKAVKEGKVEVDSLAGGVIKITPNIGIEATVDETKSVVFGSDILPNKGSVVTRTFEGEDFKYTGENNTLTINCSSVITKLSEIPDSKTVWFLIRNDSTRKSIPNYPGTRALAAYKSRMTGNVIKISSNERGGF
jgi:hypothetical protein